VETFRREKFAIEMARCCSPISSMSGASEPVFCDQITDGKCKLASWAAEVFGGETRGDGSPVEQNVRLDPGVHLALELDC